MQISAGKYRRYAGLKWYERMFDIKTFLLNLRDIFRTLRGFYQAIKLLKKTKPDALLIKGGFVAVPMGLAAALLHIPYVTHDSDTTPGLANRLIGRWAACHATGMPTDLYNYPKEKTVFTGIPVSERFEPVDTALRLEYRKKLSLEKCNPILTIVGGSLGAGQLNSDMVSIMPTLMRHHPALGVVHVAGDMHSASLATDYTNTLESSLRGQVIVQGFTQDIYISQGAADVVVARAGATQLAEMAIQNLAVIVVPGRLAGGHQDKNAQQLSSRKAVIAVAYANRDDLLVNILALLGDKKQRQTLAATLGMLARPEAAADLAKIVLRIAKRGKRVA